LGLQGGEVISNIIAKYLNQQVSNIVSIKEIGLAVFFAVLVGVFFGIYPAFRAARLDPNKALSYE
jgi:putative ABC transport system permease protein